jgi:hypothetical protein
MKLVMTLVVRDEDDVIDASLTYHLGRGVDFFIATDHDSQDGTTEILERYAREGHLHLIRETGEDFAQDRWQTQMARLAATEFGADWVINADADEFWCPAAGTLKDLFAAVPPQFSVVRAAKPEFIPRPGEEGFFADRLVVREVLSTARPKVAHRGLPNIIVGRGCHGVRIDGENPSSTKDYRSEGILRQAYPPVRIFHFPVRSYAQFEKMVRNRMRVQKKGKATYLGGWLSGEKHPSDPDEQRSALFRAYEEGRLAEFYASKLVDDEAVGAGIREGRFTIDRRFQCFFAEHRKAKGVALAGQVDSESESQGAEHGSLDRCEVTEIQSDIVRARERELIVRLERWERRRTKLESRLSAIENSYWWRAGRRFSPLLRLAALLLRLPRAGGRARSGMRARG